MILGAGLGVWASITYYLSKNQEKRRLKENMVENVPVIIDSLEIILETIDQKANPKEYKRVKDTVIDLLLNDYTPENIMNDETLNRALEILRKWPYFNKIEEMSGLENIRN